jgi:DNA invertase Pin-like site-specific DNA recombinase
VAYARVSSHDQKDDLQRQKQALELYCARQGWVFDVVADLGSGMNDHKKGLQRLRNGILGLIDSLQQALATVDADVGKTLAPIEQCARLGFGER